MSIAFDASSGGNATGAASITFSHTCTGSNRILFVSCGDQANDITGVTYNGVAMTLVAITNVVSIFANLYYLVAPATGANNVVVSRSGSSGFLYGSSASYTGASQTGVPDNSVSNIQNLGASGAIDLTANITTVADMCWTVLSGAGSTTLSAGAGSTSRNVQGSTLGIFDSNAMVSPAGATSMTIHTNGGGTTNLGAVIASFAPFSLSTSTLETMTVTEVSSTVKGKVSSTLETLSLTEIKSVLRGAVFSVLETLSLTDLFRLGAVWVQNFLSATSWTNGTKHSSSMSQASKSSTTWVNKNKI